MRTLKLKEDFYWIGSQDPNLRVFDIIMETKYGTTYNSYLLKTKEGIVLFESVKEKCFEEYIEKIKEIASIEEIKYIVCDHTEPDHSGSIAKLLALNPNIVVVSTAIANMYLKEIINQDFKAHIVKENDVLKLGDKTIRFIMAPNLHWPDAMYSYLEEDQVLVTCDSFGAHYAHEGVLLSSVKEYEAYEEAFAYYSTMIMGPFKPFVVKAVDKLKDINISLIAPGHGPIIDTKIDEILEKYRSFSKEETRDEKRVVIPYVSAYGYTKEMAEIISGIIVKHDLSCELYDLVESDEKEVVQKMIDADVILYGSPTILNDALPPIYQVMNQINAGYHGIKIVSAFGSYGWSGEAVKNILVRAKQQRMKIIDEGLKIKFKASDEQKNEVIAYAENIIKNI